MYTPIIITLSGVRIMHIHHLGPNIHVKENLPVAKQGVCLQLHSRLHQFQSELERERERERERETERERERACVR